MGFAKHFIILSMTFSSISTSAAAAQPERQFFGAKCQAKGNRVITFLYAIDFSEDLIYGMYGTTEYSSFSDCEAGKNPYSHYESFGPLKYDSTNGKFSNNRMTVAFSNLAALIDPNEEMKMRTTATIATIEWLPSHGESLRVVQLP